MSAVYTYFAPCPLGLEAVLAEELNGLGIEDAAPARAGVSFTGPLEAGYKVCFWSRVASRVLLQLLQFDSPTPEALYEGVGQVKWYEHFRVDQTFSVGFNSTRSQITHTNFGALKSKDAIVDQFRSAYGSRPNVSRDNPALRIDVHIEDDGATVSLDLSGGSLHRRTGRRVSGSAPLKENLAAGLLLMADWPEYCAQGKPFLDPMCGVGSLPVEAALIACDTAPGLLRESFGFEHWKGHDRLLLRSIRRDAAGRDRRTDPPQVAIEGFDVSRRAVDAAQQNVRDAGVQRLVALDRSELSLVEPTRGGPGLLMINPPYGERMGVEKELRLLYRRIGMTLKGRFPEWRAHLLTGNSDLAKEVGLRSSARRIVYNSTIECRLLEYQMLPEKTPTEEGPGGQEMVANRLTRNRRKLKSWLKRDGVTCYRIYDRDLPEYAVTIDRYEDWLYIREDERPDTIDPLKAETRLHHAVMAAVDRLEVKPSDVFVRHRGRKRGSDQYGKVAEEGEKRQVQEGGLRFLVNPADYLDTGLFLDHRWTRGIIRDMAKGKDFLNLFAYTGAASVYAACGGAKSTTTVDLSSKYLEWAKENMTINGFTGPEHTFLRFDVLQWWVKERRTYDLIFLDPPTYSTSKAMNRTLDIQRDHPWLLNSVAQLLKPDGTIIFSNNFRRFKMEAEKLHKLSAKDITGQTVPPDFSRNKRIHNCWLVTKLTE
jgi:23S rRNA (guanine2445-N2)-methyltransferase / 23S rRNA (guanine2069-N7)-methyltransferase